jgi:hypothetical protein
MYFSIQLERCASQQERALLLRLPCTNALRLLPATSQPNLGGSLAAADVETADIGLILVSACRHPSVARLIAEVEFAVLSEPLGHLCNLIRRFGNTPRKRTGPFLPSSAMLMEMVA